MKNIEFDNKGITLIALVITIIVLLILAGVTIASVTGENGILNKAVEAKNSMQEASTEEKIKMIVETYQMDNKQEDKIDLNKLQVLLDNEFGENNTVSREDIDGTITIHLSSENKEYNINKNDSTVSIIDWNEKMKEAKAPEEQSNKKVIGIGTNGNVVNMDLWHYAYDTVTNGYALNSSDVLQNTEYNKKGTNTEKISKSGYFGNENDIIVPQYISEDEGKNYIPVTSLYRTFQNNIEIEESPNIPTTVVNMLCTFESCINLKKAKLPYSVINIEWIFNGSGIENVPFLGNNVILMQGAFSRCKSLKVANITIPYKVESLQMTFLENTELKEANVILPENLKNMRMTFYHCTSLEKGPEIIPENVTNIQQTFQGDVKLHGEMTIKASPVDYGNSFGENCAVESGEKLIINEWNGNREILQKILKQSDWTRKYIVGKWEL